MKFGQYLHDTQTPEWKKAYIDYRGLKKRINAIRKSQQGFDSNVLSSDESPDEAFVPRPSDLDSNDLVIGTHFPKPSASINPPPSNIPDRIITLPEYPAKGPDSNAEQVPPSFGISSSMNDRRFSTQTGAFNFTSLRAATRAAKGRSFSSWHNGLSSGGSQRHPQPLTPLPLHELLEHLTPQEVSFFTMLDAQLDKVESFYIAREKEMLDRSYMLQIQLNELNDHRKLFHETNTQVSWLSSIVTSTKNKFGLRHFMGKSPTPRKPLTPKVSNGNFEISLGPSFLPYQGTRNASPGDCESAGSTSALPRLPTIRKFGKRLKDPEQDDDSGEDVDSVKDAKKKYLAPLSADPDSYLSAKRKLKKAVLEHYRGLEVLHNYRVLNITGFRKALKKFEKVTKISVQEQYMTGKVDKCTFASDTAVRQMMTQMEDLYASAFARGDKKMANKRLRTGGSTRTHHFSTFRAGVYLGLGIPALFQGLVRVFEPEVQQAVPYWDSLLFVYGVILVPVLFSLLVGINLLVWAESRINYSFIFELDVLTQLDHRKYFEIPAILLSTLFTAFWLSFNVLNSPGLSPTIWPLIWLALAVFMIFDPLPFQSRPSRFWLVKNVAKQLMSGTKSVEFTDFWMGDQFCSMTFTLSNLYFFVCVYAIDFSPDQTNKCGLDSPRWPIAFVCTVSPLVARLLQSLKRYYDSRSKPHLINAGKYGSGIISYLFYFLWRYNNSEYGTIFVVWCTFSMCYSLYALLWDLLIDWSFFNVHCKYPLLRSELVYMNHVPMYYFAIVSNTIIRFIWVIYIPRSGPSLMVRSFIIGLLEMMRRWQWNFYRLENEHLGNMDQYRVTREVPLPYAFNESRRDDGDDDDDLGNR